MQTESQNQTPPPASTITAKLAAQSVMRYLLRNDVLVGNLVGRWADEREYEDLAEYQPVLQKALPPLAKIERMKGRPFGCVVSLAGFRLDVSLLASGTIKIREARA